MGQLPITFVQGHKACFKGSVPLLSLEFPAAVFIEIQWPLKLLAKQRDERLLLFSLDLMDTKQEERQLVLNALDLGASPKLLYKTSTIEIMLNNTKNNYYCK